MRTRAVAALLTVAALVTASCGGGGDSGPTEAEFRSELEEICAATTRAAEEVDVPDLEDLDNFEDFAQDLGEIVQKARSDIEALEVPDEPEDLAGDVEKLKENLDEEIEVLADLEQAGKDEDVDDITEAAEKVAELQEEREEIADDLNADDCKPEERDVPVATDPGTTEPDTSGPDASTATTVVLTLPPTLPPETSTTAPPTTAPRPTLPPVTLPPATDPPETDPPETAPPETAPPDTGVAVLFDIMDIPARFNAFPGFTLAPPDTTFEQIFIEGVASNVLLNIAIEEMGVANIVDSNGDLVAFVVVGFARNEELGVPNAWKDQDCPPEQALPRQTPGGFFGVYCDFRSDTSTSLFEVFSATTTGLGFTIATVTPINIDVLVDGFLGANI
jgi:hypothetical protein